MVPDIVLLTTEQTSFVECTAAEDQFEIIAKSGSNVKLGGQFTLENLHLTFSSVLKIYTYSVLPQLRKIKPCLIKGRKNGTGQ
jgi:hypothetical protein